MRGKDEQQLDVFSYVSPEQRVPQHHPLRRLRVMTDEGIKRTATTVPQAVRENRAAVDRAGEVVASAPAASAVLGAQRTAVDGTARLQSAVPLVRGLEHGRRHLGCDRVHEKPRAPARWGHCRSLLPSRAPAGAGAESALGRALHRGWNATGSVGECEKLSTQGWQERRSAGRSWQCDGGLPRGEAVEPDARIEDGPGCEDGTQRQGQRSEAVPVGCSPRPGRTLITGAAGASSRDVASPLTHICRDRSFQFLWPHTFPVESSHSWLANIASSRPTAW